MSITINAAGAVLSPALDHEIGRFRDRRVGQSLRPVSDEAKGEYHNINGFHSRLPVHVDIHGWQGPHASVRQTNRDDAYPRPTRREFASHEPVPVGGLLIHVDQPLAMDASVWGGALHTAKGLER